MSSSLGTGTPKVCPTTHTRDRRCVYGIPTCTGCTFACRRTLDDGASEIESMQRCSASSVVDPLLIIQSTTAVRCQLKQEFVWIFGDRDTSEMDFMYSHFLRGAVLDAQGPCMEAALDTLYVMHIAAYRKDDVVAREALRRRIMALARVRAAMQSPTAIQDDDLLGAMWILKFCDSFQGLLQMPLNSRVHQEALEKILVARGDTLPRSRLAQCVCSNAQATGFSFGMARRQPMVRLAGTLDERDIGAVTLPQELIGILSQIPGLLHSVDRQKRLNDFDLRSDAHALLDRLTQMETWLLSWYVRWLNQTHIQSYHMVSLDTFPHFRAFYMPSPNPYPKALQFASFSSASLQITYWTGLLQTKAAIRDVMTMLCCKDLEDLRGTSIVLEADECADLLVQSVAFVTCPAHGYCGVLRAMAPLFFAQRWFLRRCCEQKAAWCASISKQAEQSYTVTSPYAML